MSFKPLYLLREALLFLMFTAAWAQVRQGDVLRADGSKYDMIYQFQRPDSMPRAVAQASAKLRSGTYLMSLEFEAQAMAPLGVLRTVANKHEWAYHMPRADKASA